MSTPEDRLFSFDPPIPDRPDTKIQTRKTQFAFVQEWSRITEKLHPEDVDDPTAMLKDWLDTRLGDGIIVFGENGHQEEGQLAYQARMIKDLHAHTPIHHVFLEEDEALMPAVQEFYATGVMSEELRTYLREGFVREPGSGQTYASPPPEHKRALLQTCRDLKIPVTFIDDNTSPYRDADWMVKMHEVIGKTIQGTYILIAGKTHAAKKLDLASVKTGTLPAVAQLLDWHYPNRILSVCASWIEPQRTAGVESMYDIIRTKFSKDLTELGETPDQPHGVWLEYSPYRESALSAYNLRQKASAYDAFFVFPGGNLRDRMTSIEPDRLA